MIAIVDYGVGNLFSLVSSFSAIGEDAVVGAGSIVTKDIPAGEVWAGNPAVSTQLLFWP